MPYAVTKAAQLQLIKCLGATQGPKIRVNTVLPGLLLTEWVCLVPLSENDVMEGLKVSTRAS
jgi:NAD(P)-dependent dehydrogenase (short-subunit alcohol dehydrogenase family)